MYVTILRPWRGELLLLNYNLLSFTNLMYLYTVSTVFATFFWQNFGIL